MGPQRPAKRAAKGAARAVATPQRATESTLRELGARLAGPDELSTSDIVRDLAACEAALEQSEQGSLGTQRSSAHLCRALATPRYLGHPDQSVRLLAACCACQVLRVHAPESPFSDDELKAVFEAFGRALSGLADPGASRFPKTLGFLRLFGRIKAVVLLLDADASPPPGPPDQPLLDFVDALLGSLNPQNDAVAGGPVQEVLSTVLSEGDLTTSLLSTVLVRILPPLESAEGKRGGRGDGDGKRTAPAAPDIPSVGDDDPAARRVRAALAALEPALAPSLRKLLALMLGPERVGLDSSELSRRRSDLLVALYQAVPGAVSPVVPLLRDELLSEAVGERAEATAAAIRLFAPGAREATLEPADAARLLGPGATDAARATGRGTARGPQSDLRSFLGGDAARRPTRAPAPGRLDALAARARAEHPSVLAALLARFRDSDASVRASVTAAGAGMALVWARQGDERAAAAATEALCERLEDADDGARERALAGAADLAVADPTRALAAGLVPEVLQRVDDRRPRLRREAARRLCGLARAWAALADEVEAAGVAEDGVIRAIGANGGADGDAEGDGAAAAGPGGPGGDGAGRGGAASPSGEASDPSPPTSTLGALRAATTTLVCRLVEVCASGDSETGSQVADGCWGLVGPFGELPPRQLAAWWARVAVAAPPGSLAALSLVLECKRAYCARLGLALFGDARAGPRLGGGRLAAAEDGRRASPEAQAHAVKQVAACLPASARIAEALARLRGSEDRAGWRALRALTAGELDARSSARAIRSAIDGAFGPRARGAGRGGLAAAARAALARAAPSLVPPEALREALRRVLEADGAPPAQDEPRTDASLPAGAYASLLALAADGFPGLLAAAAPDAAAALVAAVGPGAHPGAASSTTQAAACVLAAALPSLARGAGAGAPEGPSPGERALGGAEATEALAMALDRLCAEASPPGGPLPPAARSCGLALARLGSVIPGEGGRAARAALRRLLGEAAAGDELAWEGRLSRLEAVAAVAGASPGALDAADGGAPAGGAEALVGLARRILAGEIPGGSGPRRVVERGGVGGPEAPVRSPAAACLLAISRAARPEPGARGRTSRAGASLAAWLAAACEAGDAVRGDLRGAAAAGLATLLPALPNRLVKSPLYSRAVLAALAASAEAPGDEDDGPRSAADVAQALAAGLRRASGDPKVDPSVASALAAALALAGAGDRGAEDGDVAGAAARRGLWAFCAARRGASVAAWERRQRAEEAPTSSSAAPPPPPTLDPSVLGSGKEAAEFLLPFLLHALAASPSLPDPADLRAARDAEEAEALLRPAAAPLAVALEALLASASRAAGARARRAADLERARRAASARSAGASGAAAAGPASPAPSAGPGSQLGSPVAPEAPSRPSEAAAKLSAPPALLAEPAAGVLRALRRCEPRSWAEDELSGEVDDALAALGRPGARPASVPPTGERLALAAELGLGLLEALVAREAGARDAGAATRAPGATSLPSSLFRPSSAGWGRAAADALRGGGGAAAAADPRAVRFAELLSPRAFSAPEGPLDPASGRTAARVAVAAATLRGRAVGRGPGASSPRGSEGTPVARRRAPSGLARLQSPLGRSPRTGRRGPLSPASGTPPSRRRFSAPWETEATSDESDGGTPSDRDEVVRPAGPRSERGARRSVGGASLPDSGSAAGVAASRALVAGDLLASPPPAEKPAQPSPSGGLGSPDENAGPARRPAGAGKPPVRTRAGAGEPSARDPAAGAESRAAAAPKASAVRAGAGSSRAAAASRATVRRGALASSPGPRSRRGAAAVEAATAPPTKRARAGRPAR